MKTFIVAPDLFASEGGIPRILRLYVRALVNLSSGDDRLAIAALNDRGETLPRTRALGGGRLVAVANGGRRKVAFGAGVLLRALWADRLICGHLNQLVLAWIASRMRPSLRYHLVAHGIEVWRPFSTLERAALRGAHRIFCVSEYTRRQMLRFDPELCAERLVVVANTFDPEFSRRPPRPAPNADSGSPRILAVSRLLASDPYKGIDTMIEAMPLIRREFPRAQLRIVGGGDDAPRLRELARSCDGSVVFTGMVDDGTLQAEYAACDLFALPSRKEGFGLVYLEAMSHGKPCLAARAGGAIEVVNEGVGALVEYGNVEQIAVAVADLVHHPRSMEAIAARVAEFAFPAFQRRLSLALTDAAA